MVTGVGKKTSVYLSDDLAERVRASGVPLAELIRRGLDAEGPASLEETLARVVREEMSRGFGLPYGEDGTPRGRTRAVQAGARDSAGTATAVFQQPGGEAVVTAPVPSKTVDEARDQLDRAVARKSAAKGPCEHRVQPGSYCRRCGRLI